MDSIFTRMARPAKALAWACPAWLGVIIAFAACSATPLDSGRPRDSDVADGGSDAQFALSCAPFGICGPETLARGQTYPETIAIDDLYVYWINNGGASTTGSVMRMSKSGGAPELLAQIDPLEGHPSALLVDDRFLYFSISQNAGKIYRLAKGGGQAEVLVDDQFAAESLVLEGTQLYFTTGTGIMVMSLDGGAPTQLATADPVGRLVSAGPNLYFAQSDGVIYQLAKSGGALVAMTTALPNDPVTGSPFVAGLALQADSLYWSLQGLFMRMPLMGGAVTLVGHVDALLAMDEANAYSVTDGFLSMTSLATGQTSPLAATGVGNLTLDKDYIYWVDVVASADQTSAEGFVLRMAKSGGGGAAAVGETGCIVGLVCHNGRLCVLGEQATPVCHGAPYPTDGPDGCEVGSDCLDGTTCRFADTAAAGRAICRPGLHCCGVATADCGSDSACTLDAQSFGFGCLPSSTPENALTGCTAVWATCRSSLDEAACAANSDRGCRWFPGCSSCSGPGAPPPTDGVCLAPDDPPFDCAPTPACP